MFTDGRFWEAATERAVRTAAQAFLATGVVSGMSAWGIDWSEVAGVTLLAGLLSYAMSLAASGTGGDAGPSWGGIEKIEGRDDED